MNTRSSIFRTSEYRKLGNRCDYRFRWTQIQADNRVEQTHDGRYQAEN